jgi:hypothetical protein
MSLTRMTLTRTLIGLLCLLLVPMLAGAADKPSSAQRDAVREYLAAVARRVYRPR